MARASVELIVEAVKAINPLRQVKRHSEKVSQALKKNQKSVKRVEAAFVLFGRKGANALRDLEGNAARLGKRMSGLRGNIAKVAIAFAGFKSAQTGIARIESERRIELLGKQFGEVAELQGVAAQAAQKFKLSQTEANQAIANAFARLRPLGVSLKDISSTFGGFRTAAMLGGSTAAEAAASFTQLSQALGSGALRGDEFRSIAEQAPLVLQAISDETGIAAGELKDYAKEGLLTSNIVIRALRRIETEGAGRLADALNGPSAKIKEFQNAVEDVQVAVTESAIPAITQAISDLSTVIKQLEPVIRFIGGVLAGVAKVVGNIVEDISTGGKRAAAQQAAQQAATRRTNAKFGKPGLFGRTEEAKKFLRETFEFEYQRRLAMLRGAVYGQLPSSAAALPGTAAPQTTIIKPISQTRKPTSGKSDAEIEADRLEEIARLSTERVRSLEQQTLLASAITDEERKQFERQIEIANILENTNKYTKEQLEAQIQATIALHEAEDSTAAINAANDQRKKDEDALAQKLEEQQKTLSKLDQTYLAIGQSVSNGIVDALSSAVEGTKALADVAADTLRQVANILLQFGVNTALGGIPGLEKFFGGARANGGSVTGGSSYLVGEKGPELFTPGRSGSISPSGSFGGANVTVNVDASGSNVQGDQPNAKALGSAIGAAVQSELIKQKRPGGLLAS